jgi:hypothetical protein
MCYIYSLKIDGEFKGVLYEMVKMGKSVYHNWETDEIIMYKNKITFEKQFYKNHKVYCLEQTDTLFF